MTYSRLSRKKYTRSVRLAVIYLLSTFILIIGCLFFGLPLLIRMAVFLGNLRGTYLPIEGADKFSPLPPIISSLVEATNSAQVNISGSAEAGSSVKLFLNDSEKENLISGADGSFLFRDIRLNEGENEIKATATDQAGNISSSSKTFLIIFDNLPPKIEITQPLENTSFPSDKRKIEIKGQTDPEANLTINDHLVIVDSQGIFSYPYSLSEGQNAFIFTAIDSAGNRTETQLNLRLE